MEIPNEKELIKNKNKTNADDEEKQTAENKIRQRQPRDQISSDAKSTECPECGKVFTTKRAMVTHYRSKHEGIKYFCHQCDFQGSTQSHLKSHIQSKHEGIKYPCNQCDYQATTQGSLQTQITAKHSDNILQYEVCDYQTKWMTNYNTRKKAHTTASIKESHVE